MKMKRSGDGVQCIPTEMQSNILLIAGEETNLSCWQSLDHTLFGKPRDHKTLTYLGGNWWRCFWFVKSCHSSRSNRWLIDWMFDWLIDWLIDWSMLNIQSSGGLLASLRIWRVLQTMPCLWPTFCVWPWPCRLNTISHHMALFWLDLKEQKFENNAGMRWILNDN